MNILNIHLNCDMAESYGSFHTGDDSNILPFVDAVNLACGFHAGDPLTLQSTIKAAVISGKQIGAHPSYPDLVGFGRRYMDISNEELFAGVLYQVCALKAMTESLGGKLHHVKPHGALYNLAARDSKIASIIVEVIKLIDKNLLLFAPFNSQMSNIAEMHGIKVMAEAFADRRYNQDGTLAPRNIAGAIIDTPEIVARHVQLLVNGKAETIEGDLIEIVSDTICLHGDHPNVVKSLKLIRNIKTD
ncbi:MAG: LamB/YcsF family protein [Saprospiraceae bacterium]|nr:LamB/YcsF family protein [Saprospiraceae bacterium]